MAWLGTWANRIKLTIDSSKVDTANLTDFPVMVKLSTASGIGDVDVSAVFDELGPSASSANEFATDPNCVALWKFENGALTADSIGTNTLTDNNTVGTETGDYKEGSACADFEQSNSEALTIADADLDSDFPLKSGDTNKKISACGWFKLESTSSDSVIFSKYDSGADKRGIVFFVSGGNFMVVMGHTNGTGYEILYQDGSPATGKWYHFGFTFQDSDKSWKLVIWDDTASSKVVDTSGTATNNISIVDVGFGVGCSYNSGSINQPFDGLIDEVVVFKDILTTDEIDTIRQGSYNNRKKIAVTTDDGTTQCYVEIEKWDDANEEAILHVKVPTVAYDADTILYLYYDSAQSDNTSYVGDTTDAVTHNVWDSNFVAVYHMAQDPNGDGADAIKDSTSNANDGTPDGTMLTADLVTGKVGDAIVFDGTDDQIKVDDHASLDITAELTLEAIIKTANDVSTRSIMSKDTAAGGNRSYDFQISNANKLQTVICDDGLLSAPENYVVLSSGADINDDAYHHVAMVYVPSTSVTLHIDGPADGVETTDVIASIYSSAADVRIANYYDDVGTYCFPGTIDEVRISSTARSAAWIKATYNSLWDSLVTLSDFEEYDSSISATTATLTLTANAATISYDLDIQASAASLTITANTASVSYGITVFATAASLTLTANVSGITHNVNLAANTATLALATQQANVALAMDITATIAALTLATNAADIEVDVVNVWANVAQASIFQDHFTGANDAAPDTNYWSVTSGISIQNNRLRFANNNTKRTLTSLFTLTGDFDVQVDFFLNTYPDSDSWSGHLMFWDSDDSGVDMAIQYYGGQRQYSFNTWIDGGWTEDLEVATSDTSGKFRIVRSGTNCTCYYWNGSAWVSIGTKDVSDINDEIYLGLEWDAWGNGVVSGGDFDAFVINSAGAFLNTYNQDGQTFLIAPQTATVGLDIFVNATTQLFTLSTYDATIWDGAAWEAWIAANSDKLTRKYFFTLTGDADGTTDAEMPISSFQCRRYADRPTYLSVVIPDTNYASQINARANGDMKLEMSYEVNSVQMYRETITLVDLEDIQIDEGASNASITLIGHRTVSFTSKTITLRDIQYYRLKDGSYTVRCLSPDLYLNPGDTANADGNTFTVDRVAYLVSEQIQTMEVKEA